MVSGYEMFPCIYMPFLLKTAVGTVQYRIEVVKTMTPFEDPMEVCIDIPERHRHIFKEPESTY